MLVVTGMLFLFDWRYRHRRKAGGWTAPRPWVRRNFRYVVVVGVPLLVFLATSAFNLPGVLMRVDDGDRGARVIEGNGVVLVWASAGPGWNWRQPWGGYPSWNHIALYGVEPVGIEVDKPGYEERNARAEEMSTTSVCHYLSEDGSTLTDEPQGIWRRPTVAEIVRSLPRRGENAGCTWDGRSRRAQCRVGPDKETPLWAPDEPPIYYWAADEASESGAYYVSYNAAGCGTSPRIGGIRVTGTAVSVRSLPWARTRGATSPFPG